MANYQSGDPVTLLSVPPSLLQGLPDEDQSAIRAVIGQSVTFVALSYGQAEVEFNDSEGDYHKIWVNIDCIKPTGSARAS